MRGVEFPNRVFVSPMCQYSCKNGVPTDWHLVHLGSRAVGGAGLVMSEAAAVTPEGRISPADAGIWNDEQAEAWRPITRFIEDHGAVPCVQLAHAGRKASRDAPWRGGGFIGEDEGGWTPVAPSPAPFDDGYAKPKELSGPEIDALVDDWAAAARRSLDAGFRAIELHFAHGYLAHTFLSPLSNHREDEYGANAANRARFPLRVVDAVRAEMPDETPLFVRISSTDWVQGSGWDVPDAVEFSRALRKHGVDLVDCSSGGVSPHQKMELGPGYQVPFAAAVRSGAEIATGAVGLITGAGQAEEILAAGKADAIFLARELLRNPYWPLHAALELGDDVPWQPQYERAKPVR